jgi:hypothetical protein
MPAPPTAKLLSTVVFSRTKEVSPLAWMAPPSAVPPRNPMVVASPAVAEFRLNELFVMLMLPETA